MNRDDIEEIDINPNLESLLEIAKILPCKDKKSLDAVLKPMEEDIGKTLKKRRKLADMTQNELAEMIGQSQSQIVKVESGNCNPTLRTLLLIMAAIEMKIQKGRSPCERIMVDADDIQWVTAKTKLRDAVRMMRDNGFSQLPVSISEFKKGEKAKLDDFVGFIDETSMLEESVDLENGTVSSAMNSKTEDWIVESSSNFEDLREQFKQGKNAMMVHKSKGKEQVIIGIVTKSDMLKGNFKPKEIDQQSSG
jgi:predicted transcriptional regulator